MNMAMKIASMVSKDNPAKVGVKVNPATKTALDKVDDETKLEILNRRLNSLEDDDPKIAGLVIQRNALDKALRIKDLEKELADLKAGKDQGDGDSEGDSGD